MTINLLIFSTNIDYSADPNYVNCAAHPPSNFIITKLLLYILSIITFHNFTVAYYTNNIKKQKLWKSKM